MVNDDTLCGWGEEARVKYYVETVAVSVPKRDEQLAFLLELFPWPTDAHLHVLDIGAGFGAITQEVLIRYPRSSVTCVDGSGEMMKLARERLAKYGERVSFHQADLAYRSWHGQLSGSYDAAVSGLASTTSRMKESAPSTSRCSVCSDGAACFSTTTQSRLRRRGRLASRPFDIATFRSESRRYAV
jgi:tRNA1(Val) A37 N6-methylase TrmN6